MIVQTRTFTLKDATTYAQEIKKPSLLSTSYPSCKSTVELFKKWANDSKLQEIDITYFDKLRAVCFADYILEERGYAAKTVNGHVSHLKSHFQVLFDHEVI